MSFLKKIKVAATGIEAKDKEQVLKLKNEIVKEVKAEAEKTAKQVYATFEDKFNNKAWDFAKRKNLEPNATGYVFMMVFEGEVLKKLMGVNSYAEILNSVESAERYY
jgi:hypothetical protein